MSIKKFQNWYGLPIQKPMTILLSKLKMDANTIYVIDKGYNDYEAFNKFSETKQDLLPELKTLLFMSLLLRMKLWSIFIPVFLRMKLSKLLLKMET
jgi:hypothetical protein